MVFRDAHLGGSRPFGLNYWPLPDDDPGVEIPRESIRLVSPDGALVRGVLWTPPAGKPAPAIIPCWSCGVQSSDFWPTVPLT